VKIKTKGKLISVHTWWWWAIVNA